MPGWRTRCSATSARAPRSCMLKNSIRTVSSPPRPEPRRNSVSSASSRCTEHREVDGPALAGHPPCRRGDRDVGGVARAERDETRRALEPDAAEHRRVGGVAREDRDAVRPQRGDAGAVPVLVDTDDGPAVLGQRQRQPGARGTQPADDGVPAEAAEPVALELLTEHHRSGLEQRAHRHQWRREPGHLQAPVQVAAATTVGEHGELEGEVQVVEERPALHRRLTAP